MSEVYRREFTGYYNEGSHEETRVLLNERGHELTQELAQQQALHSRKIMALYALAQEIQMLEDGPLRDSLIHRRNWLMVSRDAVANQTAKLRETHAAHIATVSETNQKIGRDHHFVHNLQYTTVNPELMITEEEMLNEHAEEITREAAAPAPAPADNQEIVLAA